MTDERDPAGIEPDEPVVLDDVQRYRESELRAVGYSEFWSVELARNPAVDLHAALDIVQRGCDPRLATEIMR